jgi:hypothetical protein
MLYFVLYIFRTCGELELNMLENVHMMRRSNRILPVFVSDIDDLLR